MTVEYCCDCDEATGHSGRGEDSIYIEHQGNEIGPLCDSCNEKVSMGILLNKLKRDNKILMEYVIALSELKGDQPMISLRYTAKQTLESIGE